MTSFKSLHIAITGIFSLTLLSGCVVTEQPQWSADVEACAAIFDTTEEELGLTPDADLAVGQRNYANWIEGMLRDANDPTLRSGGLAAAGAARAVAATYEKTGQVTQVEGDALMTALLKVQLRCKQLMGIAD